jgi:hypothetical protein
VIQLPSPDRGESVARASKQPSTSRFGSFSAGTARRVRVRRGQSTTIGGFEPGAAADSGITVAGRGRGRVAVKSSRLGSSADCVVDDQHDD